MAYYSKEDEIKNLHDLKNELFNFICREANAKTRAEEIEAAKAYAQLARLQAELQGKLKVSDIVITTPPPGAS